MFNREVFMHGGAWDEVKMTLSCVWDKALQTLNYTLERFENECEHLKSENWIEMAQ